MELRCIGMISFIDGSRTCGGAEAAAATAATVEAVAVVVAVPVLGVFSSSNKLSVLVLIGAAAIGLT